MDMIWSGNCAKVGILRGQSADAHGEPISNPNRDLGVTRSLSIYRDTPGARNPPNLGEPVAALIARSGARRTSADCPRSWRNNGTVADSNGPIPELRNRTTRPSKWIRAIPEFATWRPPGC